MAGKAPSLEARAKHALDFFVARGWTRQQAAGIVSNLQTESHFDHEAVGDGGKAYGIAQWHPDRQERFRDIFGKPIQRASFNEQLRFVQHELINDESDAGRRLRSAKTPREAAVAVDRHYERSSGEARQQRVAGAYRLLGQQVDTRRRSAPIRATPRRDQPSTYERVQARREAEKPHGGSIADVYSAYRSGKMTPAEEHEFEADVNEGAILLPRGTFLKKVQRPAPMSLPAGVVSAYNSGQMPAEERAQLEQDLKAGLVTAPKGVALTPPKPRTVGEGLELGVRGVIQGGASLLGLVANPLNATLNATGIPQALGGAPLPTDARGTVAETLTDVGLPQLRPEEELSNAIIEGGAGGLGMAGAARVAATRLANPLAQEVARIVGDAPVADLVSGGTSGAGGKIGGDLGGTPGAIAGSLIGGGVGIGAVAGAKRVRLPRATPETAATVADEVAAAHPRATLVDDAGALTEDGAEIATRTGLEPDQLAAGVTRQARRRQSGRAPKAAEEAAPDAVRRHEGVDHPIKMLGERQTDAEGRVWVKVRGTKTAAEGFVPEDEIIPLGSASGADGTVPPPPPRDTAAAAPPPPEGISPRFAEAQEEGVTLTRGEAEQDFGVQNDEQSLKALATREGEEARQFKDQQQEQIKDAVERFRSGFGEMETPAAERGAAVREAVEDLRDRGKAGVTALYKHAEELGGEGLRLDTDEIVGAAKRALVEADVPDQVKNVIRQELARFRLLGKDATTAEDGLTTVKLDDGRKVQFYGEPQELTVSNAEAFRKAISAQYLTDGPRKISQQIKTALDDALENAMESAAASETKGPVGQAYKAARAAHQEQKKTFAAKDVVQRVIDYKKGTDTAVLAPERVISEILGSGEKAVTNLRKVKAVLLSKPTPKSKQAWAAIQAQGLADIFGQAVNVQTRAISGARLNSAIAKFGETKLKVLLSETDFNQLMKLRRIIGHATVPLSGTTNPSGTFTKLANFLGQGALRFSGGFGDAAAILVSKAKDLAKTRRTLEGMKNYDGQSDAARRMDEVAFEFIKLYLETGKSGRLMPAGVTTGATATGNQ